MVLSRSKDKRVDGLARPNEIHAWLIVLLVDESELHQGRHVERGDEAIEAHLKVFGVAAELRLNLIVESFRGCFEGIVAGFLLFGSWRRRGFLRRRGGALFGRNDLRGGRGCGLRNRGWRRFGLSRWSYGTSFVFLSEAATVGDCEFWFVLFIGHRDVMLRFVFLKDFYRG